MNDSVKEKENIKDLRQRINELESLMEVDRVLVNILDPVELYAVVADFINKKLMVRNLAIFEYGHDTEEFRLVFSDGLDVAVFAFKKGNGRLWQKILQDEPFSVNEGSGDSILSEFYENDMLNKLHSEYWIPLITKEKVMGLLTIGKKTNGQPFEADDFDYIKHIAGIAPICLKTCRLYVERQKEKKELDKILQNLSLLYNISKAMTYISDLKNLLKYILGQAIEVAKAEKGSIMLYDPGVDELSVSIIEGLDDKDYQEKINNKQVECKSFKPGKGVANGKTDHFK